MVLGSKFLKVGWNVLSELGRHFAERIQVGLWHEHGSTSDPNSVNPLSRRGLNPVKSLRSLSRPRIWRDERVRYDGFRGFCVSVRGTIFSSILLWFTFFLLISEITFPDFLFTFFLISFFSHDIRYLNIWRTLFIRGSFVGQMCR